MKRIFFFQKFYCLKFSQNYSKFAVVCEKSKTVFNLNFGFFEKSGVNKKGNGVWQGGHVCMGSIKFLSLIQTNQL